MLRVGRSTWAECVKMLNDPNMKRHALEFTEEELKKLKSCPGYEKGWFSSDCSHCDLSEDLHVRLAAAEKQPKGEAQSAALLGEAPGVSMPSPTSISTSVSPGPTVHCLIGF